MMRWRITQWRPRDLLAAWCVWWVGVVGVTLGGALLAITRVTRGAGEHGSVSAGFDNSTLSLTVINAGKTVWAGSASLLSIVLVLCGPPLVLWLLWIRSRNRYPSLKDTGAHLLNRPADLPLGGVRHADAAAPVEVRDHERPRI
jgi:hypothetical protein